MIRRLTSSAGHRILLREQVLEALLGLRNSPLRTALILLSIVISTAAVLSILTVGQAASEEIIRSFERMGVNSAILGFELLDPDTAAPQIDLQRIKAASGNRAEVAPVIVASETARHNAADIDVVVVGTTAQLLSSAGLVIRDGRFLTEVPDASAEIVVGSAVALKLGIMRPGARIRIGVRIFTAIGILEKTPSNPLFPFSFDQSLLVSMNSINLLQGRPQSGAVVLNFPGVEILQNDAPQIVEQLSRSYPRYKFDLQMPVKLIEGMRAQAQNQRVTLLCIGAITIVIAGLGIMNTMFMSVTARFAEIGVRLSIGAKATDIRNLFLLEGAILGLSGAIIGVFLAALAIHTYAHTYDKTLPFSFSNIAIALVIPMISTILFCLFPSLRASRVQPSDMLREG
jgi:putative ABC transport system permease protein